MSMCGVCQAKIEDGQPYDDEHLGYDGCVEREEQNEEIRRYFER